MPDEYDLPGQEDWVPPELLERAKEAAQRDAESAERKLEGGKQEKPKRKIKPRKQLPNTAAAAISLAIVLLLGDWLCKWRGWGGAALPEGPLELWSSAAVGVATLLLCLCMLLPLPRRGHRLRLLLLSALTVGLTFALALLQNGSGENLLSTLLSFSVVMLFLPPTWLLVGTASLKRTERFAALMGIIATSMSFYGSVTKPDGFTLSTVLTTLYYLALAVALWFWPVTAQSILRRAGEDSTDLDSLPADEA